MYVCINVCLILIVLQSISVELSRQLKEMKNHSKKEPPRDAKNKVARTKGEADKPYLPKSDAILNCPACMVTLSLDCQR